MDLTTLSAIAHFVVGDLRKRARQDERGMSTIEYAVIATVVIAVAVLIVAVIMNVAQDKISGIK